MDGTHQRDSCGLYNTRNAALVDRILGMECTQANIHIALRAHTDTGTDCECCSTPSTVEPLYNKPLNCRNLYNKDTILCPSVGL